MKIFYSSIRISIIESTAVALGNFDGIHKGHQVLIREAVRLAEKNGLKSAVFTFPIIRKMCWPAAVWCRI